MAVKLQVILLLILRRSNICISESYSYLLISDPSSFLGSFVVNLLLFSLQVNDCILGWCCTLQMFLMRGF